MESFQLLQRIKVKSLAGSCLIPGEKYRNMIIAEGGLKHRDIISYTAEHRQGLGGRAVCLRQCVHVILNGICHIFRLSYAVIHLYI